MQTDLKTLHRRSLERLAAGIGTALVLACALWVDPVAQDKASQKPSRDRGDVQREEAEDYYSKWLEEDVAYIVTGDERTIFLKLTTEEEKDAFIEQFWFRRDPDPRTAVNEYKEEHYRRIQYANERFHAGIPGWKTDRGRIYIMFGPPDRKESYPSGGWYQRKLHEGGGSTSVFPFEIWEYRYLDGVGDDIELEFVDQSGGNLYRLTTNAQDKDEFLHVPGMGLTFDEMFNPDFEGRKSPDRVLGIRDAGFLPGIPERTKDSPFAKTELLMRVSKAPVIRYDDLKGIVTSEISFDHFDFVTASHHIRIDSGRYLVPITVGFKNADVTFKDDGTGRWASHLQVYGMVRSLEKRIVTEFDDDIRAVYSQEQLQSALQLQGVHQKKVMLAPGRYRLDLVVKDVESGRMGTKAVSVNVPIAASDDLSFSSLILTRNVEASGGDLSEPFVLGTFKVKPQIDRVFPKGAYLGFYFEIYNYQVDQASQQPSLRVEYAIAPRGAKPENMRLLRRGLTMSSERIYLARMVNLAGLEPGRHTLHCTVSDQLSGRTADVRAHFEIR